MVDGNVPVIGASVHDQSLSFSYVAGGHLFQGSLQFGFCR
jgi:hypothetical protein